MFIYIISKTIVAYTIFYILLQFTILFTIVISFIAPHHTLYIVISTVFVIPRGNSQLLMHYILIIP